MVHRQAITGQTRGKPVRLMTSESTCCGARQQVAEGLPPKHQVRISEHGEVDGVFFLHPRGITTTPPTWQHAEGAHRTGRSSYSLCFFTFLRFSLPHLIFFTQPFGCPKGYFLPSPRLPFHMFSYVAQSYEDYAVASHFPGHSRLPFRISPPPQIRRLRDQRRLRPMPPGSSKRQPASPPSTPSGFPTRVIRG